MGGAKYHVRRFDTDASRGYGPLPGSTNACLDKRFITSGGILEEGTEMMVGGMVWGKGVAAGRFSHFRMRRPLQQGKSGLD